MRTFFLWACMLFLVASCKNNNTQELPEMQEPSLSAFPEKFRPQFHFSPPEKWMNDPNGLVYQQGVYHLFYQYYPDDIVWGPMHWGHATSKDMVRWEHQPIALYPDEHGLIFSGSAVIDKNNTSGFGSIDNPAMVAVFTYHLMEGEKAGRDDFQTQGIAYSLDNGQTWTKYEGNPVIGNDGIKDFRDPKVFWHEDSEQWIMVLVAGDHAKLYNSPDLKEWNLMSEFGQEQGAHGGVWECPDLFKLPVAGTDEEKWVLLISINPGAPNGGSGTQYFVGEFDGTTFSSDQTEAKWLDYGRDNYAGVTYNDTPNGERIFIGWMSNWDYARDTPTEVWRSAMTVPRTLTLHKEEDQYFVKNYPVASIDNLAEQKQAKQVTDTHDYLFEFEADALHYADISFTADLSQSLSIRLANEQGEQVVIGFDPEEKEISFDRRNSGIVDFEPRFAPDVQRQPYEPIGENISVRLLVDASSMELFVDEGRYVFTNQIFPKQPYTQLQLVGEGAASIAEFNTNQLTSIWIPNE